MAVYLWRWLPLCTDNCWVQPHSASLTVTLASSSAPLSFSSPCTQWQSFARVLWRALPSRFFHYFHIMSLVHCFPSIISIILTFTLLLPPAVMRSWSAGSIWASWSGSSWWSWWMKTCCLMVKPLSSWRLVAALRRATSHRWRGRHQQILTWLHKHRGKKT